MKSKKSKLTGCPEALSSQCVVWNGAEIPCLGISNGDTISDVVCDIANKVCKIAKDIDVSQVDLSCLLDLCDLCPEEKNLKSIIQLLLDNQCKLKTLIDSIDGSSSEIAITLNLRCLKKFDDFGNEIVQDLNQALQSLVNRVCEHDTDISSIKVEIIDLQDQIDNIPVVAPYIEPHVATCLTPSRPLSIALPLVAQQVCEFQGLVGDAASITAAISQQCANLNPTYQSVPGWEITVDTLAQSLNNLWIMACDINTRIKNIEDNCCAISCDDVDIKFQITDNENGDGVTILFSALYGNKVPAAFTDCGSTISFTDVDNKTVRGVIKVAQESTSQEYDLSALNLEGIVKISIQAKLCSASLTCVKCVQAEHMVSVGGCAACDIVITGTSGTVTIFYTVGTGVDTITAHVDDTVYIPKTAINVSYITNSGDAAPDTSCLTILEASYSCYTFAWELGSGGHAPLDDAQFMTLYVGTNTFAISSPYEGYVAPGVNHSAVQLAQVINDLHTPIIESSSYNDDGINSYLIVKAVGTEAPKLKVWNPTGVADDYLYVYGELRDNCDIPEGFSDGSPTPEVPLT